MSEPHKVSEPENTLFYYRKVQQLEAENATLHAALTAAQEALRDVEWRGIPYGEVANPAYCPSCQGLFRRGHNTPCLLAAALAQAAPAQGGEV